MKPYRMFNLALRTLMIAGSPSSFGLGLDFLVLLAATVLVVLIGAQFYPRIAV